MQARKLSEEELRAKIAALEARIAADKAKLGTFKRAVRAMIAGRASGRARQQDDRDAAMRAAYQQSDKTGAWLVAIARQFNVAPRTVQRICRPPNQAVPATPIPPQAPRRLPIARATPPRPRKPRPPPGADPQSVFEFNRK